LQRIERIDPQRVTPMLSPTRHSRVRRAVAAIALSAGAAIMSGTAFAAVPAHPQVLFALANSQSVDGDLSGAIVTGSGGLAANLSALQASSSPVNYTVPAGFTA